MDANRDATRVADVWARLSGLARVGPVDPGPWHQTGYIGQPDLTAELRMLAGYQPQALRRGWPPVVVVDESRTETSPAALAWLLAQAGGAKLGYPVVADATGRPAAVTLPSAGSSVRPPGRFRRGLDILGSPSMDEPG